MARSNGGPVRPGSRVPPDFSARMLSAAASNTGQSEIITQRRVREAFRTLGIPNELVAKLKRYAASRAISAQEVIQQALTEYLKPQKGQGK